MEHRYYLAKLGIVLIAVGVAVAGSLAGESGVSHAFTHHPSYSAPAQLQAAAWHLTTAAGHKLACLLSHSFHGLVQPPA